MDEGGIKGNQIVIGVRGMARPVILLAFIGLAYWYWSGPFQHSENTPAVDDPKQNAEVMKNCIARENYGEAIGGYSDNASSSGEDAEELCADENSFFKIDGKWYRR
jgi:hypothetical protein